MHLKTLNRYNKRGVNACLHDADGKVKRFVVNLAP